MPSRPRPRPRSWPRWWSAKASEAGERVVRAAREGSEAAERGACVTREGGVPRASSPRGRQVAPPRCFSRERAARGGVMPLFSSRGQKTAISQVFGGSGEERRVAALHFPRSEAWALKSPAHGPARSPFFVHVDARSPNFVHLPGQKPAISHPAPPGGACRKAQPPPRAAGGRLPEGPVPSTRRRSPESFRGSGPPPSPRPSAHRFPLSRRPPSRSPWLALSCRPPSRSP